jgi:hypothetical protein
LCVLFVTSADAETPTLADALRTLRNPKADNQASVTNVEAIGVVGTQAKPGDAEAFSTLLGCIRADELPSPVRAEALRVALKLANDKQFAMLTAAIGDIAKAIPKPAADGAAQPAYYTHTGLLVIFLDALPHTTAEPAALLASLRDWAVTDSAQWKFGWARQKALRAIVQVDASETLRRNYILDIIAATPNHQPIPPDARDLLGDEAGRTELRKMFASGLEKQRAFHFSAASVLAHYGDLSILDGLRSQRQKEAPGSSQGLVDYYIWQIEAQNPPSKLVDFIASANHPALEVTLWAVERASQLGLDKAAIRSAILDHCKQFKNPSDKTWMSKRPQLVAAAIEASVLTEDDSRAIPKADPLPPSPYGQFSHAEKHTRETP